MGNRVMVLEKKKERCVVVTDEGEFLHLECSANVEVGDRIPLNSFRRISNRSTSVLRKALAVAAVLMVMLGTAGWLYMTPLEAAVVVIDINPSLEVHLNGEGIVTEIEALNEDAESMLMGLYSDGLTLDEAVNQIVNAAIDEGYLKPQDEQNVLVVSVVENDNLRAKIRKTKAVDEAEVEDLFVEALEGKGVNAMVAVQRAEMEQYRESRKLGASVNKVLAARVAEAENLDVTLEDLANRGFKQVLKGKQLPPGLLLGQNAHILNVKPKELPQHPGQSVDKEEKHQQGQMDNDHGKGQKPESSDEGGRKTQPDSGAQKGNSSQSGNSHGNVNGAKNGKVSGDSDKVNDENRSNSDEPEVNDMINSGRSSKNGNEEEDDEEKNESQENQLKKDTDGLGSDSKENESNDKTPPIKEKGSKSQENKGSGSNGKTSQKDH